MKKFFSFIIIMLITCSVFAKENYKGDVQIKGGFGFPMMTIEKSPTTTIASANLEFLGDISTTHLFRLNSVLFFGFKANLGIGFGKTNWLQLRLNNSNIKTDAPSCGIGFSLDMLLGPTLAVKCGKVVRFDFTVGMAVALVSSTANNTNYTTGGVGFGFDVSAKFIPDGVVSPILGYRMSLGFSDKYDYKSSSGLSTISANNQSSIGSIYAGIAINW